MWPCEYAEFGVESFLGKQRPVAGLRTSSPLDLIETIPAYMIIQEGRERLELNNEIVLA